MWLYVTTDGGRSYQLTGKAAPEDGAFDFTAPHDGEYGFIIRRKADRGPSPAVIREKPTLRVVVDTEKPEVLVHEALVHPGWADVIPLQWEVKDRNLDLSTLRLEYRPVGVEAWVEVWTEARIPAQAKGTHYLPGRKGIQWEVRLRIADHAGNVGEMTTTIKAR